MRRMEAFRAAGTTMLFVSHNLPAVERLCDRVALLEGGSAGIHTSAHHHNRYTGGDLNPSSFHPHSYDPGIYQRFPDSR